MALIFLLLGSVALNLVLGVRRTFLSIKTPGKSAQKHHGSETLDEIVVKDRGVSDKIAVITVDGLISGSAMEATGQSMVEFIKDQLDRAEEDDDVRAVLLKVDSPGGEVLASDEIYNALRDFQATTNGKPVIVSMGSLAASGGYYISAPCRWIVANELTITGSIGVIFHNYNYRGLMDKVGIQPDITKSGKLKDMLSGEKHLDEVLPEEKAIMQDMINESFKKFKQIVSDGRTWAATQNRKEKVTGGKTLAANWEDFADGRILSGNRAMELGLVDELGDFDAAVDRAEKLVGISDANLVSYEPHYRLPSFLRFLGASEAKSLKIDLGLNPLSKLPEGRLYFMSPLHMH
ncbi:MAG TPA: signal peptide peptidase SppA [Candidatus Limnocylindria bacterium]|nr:signal peptide peptidase SppA [Candidatus Limnocylindria bacterium]